MKEVLDKIDPPREERRMISELAHALVSEIRSQGYPARVMGSVAKGTWISGDVDIDVFVFFSPRITDREMEKKGLMVGAKVFRKLGVRHEIGYAQHPYVRGSYRGIKIDIVPCYNLRKAEVRSAVDRTPFHTKYVRANLDERKRKHVLLFKQWLKGQGLYGSELKIEGFSGYLAELLIIKYGTLGSLLRDAKGWKAGKVVDIAGHYSRKDYPRLRNNFKSPLIAIDPVDRGRNVAAVLNGYNFGRFVEAARKYTKKPSKSFFFPKPLKPLPISKLPKIVYVVFRRESVVEDILWPQMKKTAGFMAESAERNGFRIKKWTVWANGHSILAFIPEKVKISSRYQHQGPPAKMEKHAKEFRKKYPSAKIVRGKLVAVRRRKYTELDKFFAKILKDGKGIGSHLPAKGATVLVGSEIKPHYSGVFQAHLTRFLKEKD